MWPATPQNSSGLLEGLQAIASNGCSEALYMLCSSVCDWRLHARHCLKGEFLTYLLFGSADMSCWTP